MLHDLVLDYSVESLCLLDELIEQLSQQGLPVERMAEVLFAFGCYVGEVFVRRAGGRWCLAEGSALEEDAGFALIIELAPQRYCNPVGKVFKRFELGAEHGLPLFYARFAPRLEAVLETPEHLH